MRIPDGARHIIETLEQNGFAAYAVGGCVRDSLLGKQPNDWDICTAARPEQIKACFPRTRILETGIQHGTVTLLIDGMPYEVTTLRVDGAYSDGRRPDEVRFVGDLSADLLRRDFTINAMAYSPARGLFDFLHGQEDLRAGLIRCAGDPAVRFCEDALRIMRALRFAAVYGFRLEPQTACAALENRLLLRGVAAERLQAELFGLLRGESAGVVLDAFHEIPAVFLPELLPWETATATRIAQSPPDVILRLALLLHEQDATGTRAILRRLKCDGETTSILGTLAQYREEMIAPDAPSVRHWLNRLGAATLSRLLALQSALGEETASARRCMEEVCARGDCWSLQTLAVNGQDLIAAGIPKGRQLGETLDQLLEQVIDGHVENCKEVLLKTLKEQCL